MSLMQSAPGAETTIDGCRYLYFVGTGYFGLQGHPQLIQAACEATQQFGLGTATTRAGFGNAPPILDVERRAADFLGTDAAFYFASGYVGNHLLVASLAEEVDAIFIDEASHYSVFEASRLGGLPVFSFRHADAGALRERMRERLGPGQRPLVMSDGVFSALGEMAPLVDYDDVLREYAGAVICLDDCHAMGVVGRRGRGSFEHCEMIDRGVNTFDGVPSHGTGKPRLFATGTLSKAFGSYGGILCGSASMMERLRGTSHYYDGASPPPIPAAAASAAALQLVADDPSIIDRVQENARRLKRGLRGLGLETDDSPVPIVCLTLGSAENMQRIQQALAEDGILIAYMRRYSGLPSTGALRIAVFATHTDSMIDALIEGLRRIV